MSFSKLANPRATRELLERFGHDPKYRLGQNFLVDDNVIGKILDLAGLDGEGPQDDLPTVIEIGPGIGTLTVALLERARVVSVEYDPDLPRILAETTADNAERFSLIACDALKVQRGDIERALSANAGELPSMLVSNLPYQVAATVILGWFERFEFLDKMVVMVQSEVADRICAQIGTKNYGAYTVKLRLHAQVTGRFHVPPSCFMPAPRVESSVIRLERVPVAEPDTVRAACEVADAAFAQRRKNLRNSMQTRFDRQTVDELLASCSIAPTVRGETLLPQDFIALGRALLDMRG